MNKEFELKALEFHSQSPRGKIGISITKNVVENMSFAYSPGVAFPCLAISKDEKKADLYTNKANSVAIITNGTAVLGLGNLGALAAKPVMEGKSALFKMAGIDCFDIEINKTTADDLVTIISSLVGFGGINLEDIAAPICFEVEERLSAELDIPVFHDDQHGVAIVVSAAIKNALEIIKKQADKVKVVAMGAGAAAIASMRMMLKIGVKRENIVAFDSKGCISINRIDCNKYKMEFASNRDLTLEEAMVNADIFLGASTGGKLPKELLLRMSRDPIVIATANPYPEIYPSEAKEVREDVIICTGRSDFPNQVNNLLCFPYIFRVALDTGSKITDEMKLATVKALSDLGKSQTDYDRNHLLPTAQNPEVRCLLPGMILSNLSNKSENTYSLSYINTLVDYNLFLTGDKFYLAFDESKKMSKLSSLFEGMERIDSLLLKVLSKDITENFIYLFYENGRYRIVCTNDKIDLEIIKPLKPSSITIGKPLDDLNLIGGIEILSSKYKFYYNEFSDPIKLLMLSINLGNLVKN